MGVKIKGSSTVHLVATTYYGAKTLCGLNLGFEDWRRPAWSISKKAATCKTCLKIRTANRAKIAYIGA